MKSKLTRPTSQFLLSKISTIPADVVIKVKIKVLTTYALSLAGSLGKKYSKLGGMPEIMILAATSEYSTNSRYIP